MPAQALEGFRLVGYLSLVLNAPDVSECLQHRQQVRPLETLIG
jgi:hypothetical protein